MHITCFKVKQQYVSSSVANGLLFKNLINLYHFFKTNFFISFMIFYTVDYFKYKDQTINNLSTLTTCYKSLSTMKSTKFID